MVSFGRFVEHVECAGEVPALSVRCNEGVGDGGWEE